jgi:hypothetical protein
MEELRDWRLLTTGEGEMGTGVMGDWGMGDWGLRERPMNKKL